MERRLFLKLCSLSLIPIISQGKMKLFDIKKEIDIKPIIEDKKIIKKFVSTKTEEDILNEFLGENKKFLETYTKSSEMIVKKENIPFYEKRSIVKELGTRRLNLYNTHTKETFNKTYYSNGKYKKKVLDELYYFLRDFRQEMIIPIDTELIDLVYSIQKSVSSNKPLHIVSGYRTRKTNNMLRRKGRGVAKNSYHIDGKAIDITTADRSLSSLKRIQKLAIHRKKGGVGLYKSKRFIHVDTGKIRTWTRS